jgi:hypothetical protein
VKRAPLNPTSVLGLAATLLLVETVPLAAQAPGAPGGDSVTVVPGVRYAAGPLHRFLLGSGYRRLWTTPMRVELLDLGTFAGGLTPVGLGGGRQTRSLRLEGADGREYAFRSIDKDPSAILPAELRETLVDAVVQDQIGSAYPVGALAVAPILDAVGVLHAEPRLVVLPDDPRLGEFRREFAGLVGFIEERPDEGDSELASFAGATSVVGTEQLLERVEEELEVVDARAFLAARLTDLFLGDWDRHADQWRWARFGARAEDAWKPIPRDRDQAFVRMDGLLLVVARQYYPQFVRFGEDYPRMVGLTWNGRDLDRRLLAELAWPVWDSVATALARAISDAVIDRAVAALPDEIESLDGTDLRRRLRARRDDIPAAARGFYRQLASEVDIHTTDASEVADVHRVTDQAVDVVVTARDERRGTVEVFRRRFLVGETGEIRVLLHGGADSMRVHGSANPPIAVRVVGGGGDDLLVDESGTARLYDTERGDVFVRAPGTGVDTRDFEPPPVSPSPLNRDWGDQLRTLLWLSASPDVGLLAGVGVERYDFAFRTVPWASRLRVRAGWAPTARTYRVEASLRAHFENSSVFWQVDGLASGLEINRFHGFGNETALTRPDGDYRIDQSLYRFRAGIALRRPGISVRAGPTLQYARTERQPAWLAGSELPYGMGPFGQLGIGGELLFDGRDRERTPTSGLMAQLDGAVFPGIWDVTSPFAKGSGRLAAYLSPWGQLRPTLAVRVGGEKVLGRYPFHEAAFLGDAETVRLGRQQRYAGEALVHANTELRLKLGRTLILLPVDVGVFGLWDVGRVWYEGERSDRWHDAWGGGPWLAFLKPENLISLGFVHSRDGVGLWVGGGFAY